MTESLLLDAYEDQARTATRLLKTWDMRNDVTPEQLRIAQEAVFLCSRFPENVRDAVELELEAIAEDAGQSAGRSVAMRELIERSISTYRNLVEVVAGFASDLTRRGYKLLRAEKLSVIAQTLEEQAAWIEENWPVCNPEELARTREQAEGGTFSDLDEAFARIMDLTVEQWQERVRRHRTQAS